jgi:hypothetical protein
MLSLDVDINEVCSCGRIPRDELEPTKELTAAGPSRRRRAQLNNRSGWHSSLEDRDIRFGVAPVDSTSGNSADDQSLLK